MTVRAAGVHENPWGHIDYAELLKPAAAILRKAIPYVLALLLAGSAVLFAVSCKGSTVAFSSDGTVASLNVEVVSTPEAIQKGLMERESLPEDSGMLFDFGEDTSTAFWMKNTTIPLSIAFIDSSGEVLAIKDMKPLDLTPVKPPGPYRYAIEVNQGWFARNGIEQGSRATIDI